MLEWAAIAFSEPENEHGHTGPQVMKPNYLNNGPGADVYAFLSPWSQLFISSFELVTNGLNKSKFLFSWPNSFPIHYHSQKQFFFLIQELLGTEERTLGTNLQNVFCLEE